MGSFKRSLIVGTILAIPVMFAIMLIGFLVNTFSFWRALFVLFSIQDYYHPIFGFILTFIALAAWGRAITTRWVNSILSRLPLIKRIWIPLNSMADRVLFLAKGGYERVIYEQFGTGTDRWKPGFVVGRTVFNDPVKGPMPKLVVLTANFSLPDSVWVNPDDTYIVSGGLRSMGLFIASGGFVNPAELDLEVWTKEKINEIPDVSSPEDTS